MVDEGARDREALLLAARELVGKAVGLVGEADQAQRVGHLGADLRARGADHLQRVSDVVVDVAAGEQLEVLEDGADAAAQVGDPLRLKSGDVAAGDQHLALGRLQLADQQLDQGRLAAAGGPDEEHELAAVDAQADALERDVSARVDLAGPAQLDDRRLRPPLGQVLGTTLAALAAAQKCGCLVSCHADVVQGCRRASSSVSSLQAQPPKSTTPTGEKVREPASPHRKIAPERALDRVPAPRRTRASPAGRERPSRSGPAPRATRRGRREAAPTRLRW